MRQAFCSATGLATRAAFSTGDVPAWRSALSTHQQETDTTRMPHSAESRTTPLALSTSLRTHTCGELRPEHAGQFVHVCGWAHAIRDKGGVIFILVRDRHGIVQVTLADEFTRTETLEAGKLVRLEYVIAVNGKVHERDVSGVNPEMPTGGIEIRPWELRVLTPTETLPFTADTVKSTVGEDTRLKYRYLDLRRPTLQQNLMTRHRAALSVRNWLDASGFAEIETPVLTKATPEGARDYILPSRVHPGKWYALPQSPQIYKQLLMVGGMDRYFQITKCFRDEDLRADRQPEFTQIDVEMSFVSSKDVLKAAEGILRSMFSSAGFEVGEIPVITYQEAMEKYGVDAPDMRFQMLLSDISQWPEVKSSTFKPIASALEEGGIVKAFVVPGGAKMTRKTIDSYTEFVKGYGCTGLLYGKVGEDLQVKGPLGKLSDDVHKVASQLGANDGDLILCASGPAKVVNPGLGRLRVKIGNDIGEVEKGAKLAFCWVVNFPLFEWDDELGRYTSVHHPFTAPTPECVDMLDGDDLGGVLSDAYDIVCNGSEIGGGSIRISDPSVQKKVFHALGIGEAEQREKFGFLLDALKYGAPPHGGIAFGLDRCCMIMTGAKGIRDVIAFPKTTAAKDLMAGAPAEVPPQVLEELNVKHS